jgi:hypothetical protein
MRMIKSPTYILLSVDWEKDASLWRDRTTDLDYGGVMVATDFILGLLDNLNLKCTWFLEMHADYPEFNLPARFPQLTQNINSLSSNEIGIHIHWARKSPHNGWIYPVQDLDWVSGLVHSAVDTLNSMAIEPKSFRGGAFLDVSSLPKILKNSGISIDSSSFRKVTVSWPQNKADFLKIKLSYLRNSPAPYFCSNDNILRKGNAIFELPVSYNLFELYHSSLLMKKFINELKYSKNRFYSIYFHIYQLTKIDAPANHHSILDNNFIKDFVDFLTKLKQYYSTEFLTASEAKKIFRQSSHRDIFL